MKSSYHNGYHHDLIIFGSWSGWIHRRYWYRNNARDHYIFLVTIPEKKIYVLFLREIENYSTFIYSITYMYSTHIFSREVVEGQFDMPSLSVRKNLSSPDGLWILISCTKTSGMERCANICLLMLISFLDESTEYSKQVTSCISPWT